MGSFPNWGKYLLGERLCETVSSSWLYFAFIYLVIALLIAGAVVLLAGPKLAYLRGSPQTRRIRREGRPAKAVVVAVAKSDGDNQEPPDGFEDATLTREIDDGIRSLYLVSVDLVIPYDVTERYQSGGVIEVKVDKDDPDKVATTP